MTNYTVYVCDRCGEKFDTQNELKTITITQYKDNEYGDNKIDNIELCQNCKKLFNQKMLLEFMKM